MQVTQLILIITYLTSSGQCQMEPFIVEGISALLLFFCESISYYLENAAEDGVFSLSQARHLVGY